jgi:glycosyltransferase involved in cell wall biosynthesis
VNITFVACCAPRPHNPTMGLFVHEMAKACAAAGHRITVLVPVRVFPDTRLFRALIDPHRWRHVPRNLRAWVNLWRGATGCMNIEGVAYDYRRYVTLPWTNRSLKDAGVLTDRWKPALTRFAADQRPAIVIGHFLETGPLAAAIAAGSAPWAVYAHEDLDTFAQRFGLDVVRACCAGARAVFANSARTAAQLKASLAPDTAIHTAPLGLSATFLNAPPAADYDGRVFHLVYVSRFVERKNHAVLVRAAAAWREAAHSPPLDVTLVGDNSPERAPVERLIRELRLTGQVRIVSATSPHVIRETLLGAHGFIFPSRFESFGIVGLEAAALGLPLATGPHIGFTQDLAQAGWQLPTFDVESPADCLRTIHAMVEHYRRRRAEAVALQQYVRATYHWSRCVATLLANLAPPPSTPLRQ